MSLNSKWFPKQPVTVPHYLWEMVIDALDLATRSSNPGITTSATTTLNALEAHFDSQDDGAQS